jgi:hypothetical protein
VLMLSTSADELGFAPLANSPRAPKTAQIAIKQNTPAHMAPQSVRILACGCLMRLDNIYRNTSHFKSTKSEAADPGHQGAGGDTHNPEGEHHCYRGVWLSHGSRRAVEP